jgi:hypothetical protein
LPAILLNIAIMASEQTQGFSALQVACVARVVRMIKLLRLLRIAWLTRLPQFMLRLEAVVGRVLLQLIGLCASVFLLLHWATCVWYFLSWAQENDNNWLRHIGLEQAGNFEKVRSTPLRCLLQ